MRKISLPPGFDPQTVQPVAGRYTELVRLAAELLIRPMFFTSSKVAESSSRKEEIYSAPVHVNFVLDNLADAKIFLIVLKCPPLSIIPPMLALIFNIKRGVFGK